MYIHAFEGGENDETTSWTIHDMHHTRRRRAKEEERAEDGK